MSHSAPNLLALRRSAMPVYEEKAPRRKGGRCKNIFGLHPGVATHHPQITSHCLPNRHKHGLEISVTPFPSTKVASLIATDLGARFLVVNRSRQVSLPMRLRSRSSLGV